VMFKFAVNTARYRRIILAKQFQCQSKDSTKCYQVGQSSDTKHTITNEQMTQSVISVKMLTQLFNLLTPTAYFTNAILRLFFHLL